MTSQNQNTNATLGLPNLLIGWSYNIFEAFLFLMNFWFVGKFTQVSLRWADEQFLSKERSVM